MEHGLLFLEKAQGDLSNMYKCKMEQTEEDGARLFLRDVQQKRTGSGHKLKHRTFHFYIWKAWEFLRFSDFLLQSCEVGRETVLDFLEMISSAVIDNMSISWLINAIFHQLC